MKTKRIAYTCAASVAELTSAWYVIPKIVLSHNLDDTPAAVLDAEDSVCLQHGVRIHDC